jgi:hypothetical protein
MYTCMDMPNTYANKELPHLTAAGRGMIHYVRDPTLISMCCCSLSQTILLNGLRISDIVFLFRVCAGPGCACNPESALKIQFLRLVHNFCDRDADNTKNKHLMLSPTERQRSHRCCTTASNGQSHSHGIQISRPIFSFSRNEKILTF